jgi:hypothetical protein
MTKDEYKSKLNELAKLYQNMKNELAKQYCIENNHYNIGDKFTDHIGSIIIEKIEYQHTSIGMPCCVYYGTELKKDGTPKKNNPKRYAWQSNDINSSSK